MPKKSNKGILGVPRDPKRQVLLFNRFADDLPSDESDDSDYEPTASRDNLGSRKNAKTKENQSKKEAKSKIPQGQNKRKRQNAMNESTQVAKESPMKKPKLHCDMEKGYDRELDCQTAWSNFIPTEVLLKIFFYCVYSQGLIPLIGRLSRVCQRWKAICQEPRLWRKVDISHIGKYTLASDSLIRQLVKRGMTGVEDLSLDGWKKITDKGVKVLAGNCSNLRRLCLANCEAITPKSVNLLAEHCTSLTSVDLSSTKVDHNCLKNLLTSLRHQLEEFILRNCKKAAYNLIQMIQENCPVLTSLDLSGNFIRQFHIERLQASCPKLQHLQLANVCIQTVSPKRPEKEPSKGFPDLEFLSIANSGQTAVAINDDFISRMLNSSERLKVLDLRGCQRVSESAIKSLCCPALESLYIGNTDAKLETVMAVVNKWKHSLRVLDLSCNSAVRDVCIALMPYGPPTAITSLDLASTAITNKGARLVFMACPNLEELNLSACRGVGRGLKKKHSGREGLARLLSHLDRALSAED